MWPANNPLRAMAAASSGVTPAPTRRSSARSASVTDSTTSSDTDDDVDDWKAVSFDFLLANEMITSIAAQEKIKKPVKISSPTHPAPTKFDVYGEFKFVEYIPEWTHPDWDDNSITVVKPSGAKQRIEVNDMTRKLRPAILASDEVRNATPYAKRWGMHPDRIDGRSRLSPTSSSTRRVGLSQPLRMANNELRFFLTGQDLPTDLEARAHDAGVSVTDYLAGLTETRANPQILEPLLELYNMSEQDKDFQRTLFTDMTTDEKLAYGIHTVEELGQVPYDLSGPIHDLVSRKRWVSTVDRGTTKDEPRYLYNLFGRRGEYCADDEFVWLALQPALQLVTRILNSDHPCWLALLDMMSRSPVPNSRNPLGASGQKLVTIWEHLKTPALQAEAKVLEDAGFNSSRAVARFLQDRLELNIGSSYTCPLGENTDPFWGLTTIVNEKDPAMLTIQVHLSAESLWPLLVPSYTQTEKACVSLMVASTIVHELAHATNYAVMALTRRPKLQSSAIDQIRGLDKAVLEALDNIGNKLAMNGQSEPFWEDEPREELGYAFEKQLWGGPLNTLTGGAARSKTQFEFAAFDLGVDTWPSSRPDPHKERNAVLTDPPLPVDSLLTPLPVKSWAKLWTQHFWDCDFRKFGHQALKLVPDKPVPALLTRHYKRLRDLKRVFGRGEGHWLHLALSKLYRAGKGTLYIYLRELVNDRLEQVWIRKRCHHECKMWPLRNNKLEALVQKSRDQSDDLASHFTLINQSEGEKFTTVHDYNMKVLGSLPDGQVYSGKDMIDLAEYTRSLLKDIQDSFNELIVCYDGIHHHLLVELQHTQSLVVDYVRQDPKAREVLYQRYGYYLYENIVYCYEWCLDDIIKHLDDLKQLFGNSGGLTPENSADIDRIRTSLQIDKNNFTETKSYLTKDYVKRVDEGWRGKFATVPSGRYKQRTAMMEKLAVKEMLQSEEAIKGLVKQIGLILDKHKNVYTVSQRQDEELAAKMEKELQTNRERCTKAAGAPGWAGLANILQGPNSNGMHFAVPNYANYAEPAAMFTDTPPWTPAPTAGPSRTTTPFHTAVHNVAFGVTNLPEPSPPETPPPGPSTAAPPISVFTQYASTSNPFGTQQGPSVFASGSSILPQLPQPSTAVRMGGFVPGQGWRPFGDPYSVTATLSGDLQSAKIEKTEIESVFGAERFVRDQARKKEAEAAAKAAAGKGQGQGQG